MLRKRPVETLTQAGKRPVETLTQAGKRLQCV